MLVPLTRARRAMLNLPATLSGGYEGAGTDMSSDAGNNQGDFGASFDPEGTADASRPDGSPGMESQGGFGGPDDFGPNASTSYVYTPAVIAPSVPAPAAPAGASFDPEGTADASRPDGTPGIESQGGFGGPDDVGTNAVASLLAPTGVVKAVANFLARVAVGFLFGGAPGAAAAAKGSIGQMAVRAATDFFGNSIAAAPGMTGDALAASVDAALDSVYGESGTQTDVASVLESYGIAPDTKAVATNLRPLPSFVTTNTNPNSYYGPSSSGGGYIPAPLDYSYAPAASQNDSSSFGAAGALLAIGLMLFAGA